MRVPTVQDMGRRPTPRPQASPIAAPLGAVSAVAQEMEQFGSDVVDIGDHILERQSIAEARERDNWFNERARDLLYNPQSGYFSQQGGNALRSRAQVEAELERLREEAVRDLNNTASEALAPALRGRVDSYLTRMDQHALGELRVYETNQETARIASARETALADPSRISEALNEIERTIQTRAQREGWSAEQTEVVLREEESTVWRTEIERMATDDPVAALDFLRSNESELLASDFTELETALEPMAAERRGQDRATDLFRGGYQAFNHQTQMEFGAGASGDLRPNDTITNIVGSAVHEVLGPGARVVISSGLRPGDHGSQHSVGEAADFAVYRPDGSQIRWDDPEVILIAQAARSMGALGFGWGATYMGGNYFHFDTGAGGATAAPRGRVMVWSDDDGGPGDAGPGAAQFYQTLVDTPLGAPPGAGQGNRPTPPGAGVDAAMGLLRQFEGFREDPYWDVNALRLGYGSDTITDEDGRIRSVGAGDSVTRADAERDLTRRLRDEFMPSALEAVGPESFDNLTANQQAVLISLAYNYGENAWADDLAGVAAAVEQGDLTRAAQEIRALATHNGGINRGRRLSEADLFAQGGQGSSGVETPSMPDVGDVGDIFLAIEDPDEADAFLRRYNQLAEIRGAELLDAQRQASQAAFEFIEGGGRFEDLPLAMRRELGFEAARSLRNYSDGVHSQGAPTTNPRVYASLRRLEAEDPEAFRRTDLFMYADQLSSSDLRGFIDRQTAPIDPASQRAISSLMTVADSQLTAAGFNTNPDAGTSDARMIAEIEADLLRWQAEFVGEHNRQPTDLEVMERVGTELGRLMMGGAQPGDLPNMDGVTRVSASTLMTTATRQMRAAGITTTESGDEDDQRLVAAMQTRLLAWQESFIAQTGRAPSPAEMDEQIAIELTEVRIGGAWFDGERRSDVRLLSLDMDGSTFSTDDDFTADMFARQVDSGSLQIAGQTVSRDHVELVASELRDAIGTDPTLEMIMRGLARLYR